MNKETKKPERVPDILAEMRKAPAKFDEAAFDAAVSKPNGWSKIADPVAEIRRMRDGGVAQETPKLEQCGNAAALREALRESTAILAVVHGEEYSGEIGMQIDKNTEALAAPARNCDRHADELDAQLAFLNDVWLISVDRNTMLEKDKFENWTEQMKTRYGRWLFAPAKGGDRA